MSRQQDWQIKMEKEGRCIICGQQVTHGNKLCQRHKEANKKRSRERYRKKMGIPLDAPLYTRKTK